MKLILRSAAIAAFIMTASCGKDAAETVAEQFEEQAEQQEQTPLGANTVSDNVIIEGGTKKDGTPPVPNEAITFDISGTSKTAFLGEGFDVTLNSDTAITGAYIQFKTNDGMMADSYYDVAITNSISDRSMKNKIKSLRKKVSTLTEKNNETNLDVDFTAEIEPGVFCYEICVYDAQGNISAPQEVCITVESWGGKSEVVGKWQLVRQYLDSLPSDIQMPKVDYCEDKVGQRSCAQGVLSVNYSYEYCERIEYSEITMNSNGTYTERYKDISKTIIGDVAIPEGMTMNDLTNLCDGYSFAGTEAILTYEGGGYWSYLNDEDRFIFVEYNYEENYDGEEYSESNEFGDGYIYYGSGGDNGEVRLIDGKLVISSFEFQTNEFEK